MTTQRTPGETRDSDGEREWESSDLDTLYARYVEPLEQQHRGEFLALSPSGQTLLAPTMVDAMTLGAEKFGPDSLIFRVGDQIIGHI